MVENVETVGERIRRFRQMNKLSAQKLADQTGLTRSIVANIESGRRSDLMFSELIALSDALRVPVAAIVYPVEKPYSLVSVGRYTETVAHAVESLVGLGDSDVWSSTPAGELTSDLLDLGRMIAASRSRLYALRVDIHIRAAERNALDEIAVLLDLGEAAETPTIREIVTRTGDNRLHAIIRQHDLELARCGDLERQFRKLNGDPGVTDSTAETWAQTEFA